MKLIKHFGIGKTVEILWLRSFTKNVRTHGQMKARNKLWTQIRHCWNVLITVCTVPFSPYRRNMIKLFLSFYHFSVTILHFSVRDAHKNKNRGNYDLFGRNYTKVVMIILAKRTTPTSVE